ncbi:hypothetical protein [Bosea sp. ANAM02]|uniref:hypothetical protein n=1 Tax=Bosea sp. ANAM02 TaxID=2020412 RepID=UPI00140EA76F|nr:hypothetical protein [Bosea sp. ANAM02]BCB17699.1 hypothetical protein OCUBac02_05930 [Bosea sp. ANAM02]
MAALAWAHGIASSEHAVAHDDGKRARVAPCAPAKPNMLGSPTIGSHADAGHEHSGWGAKTLQSNSFSGDQRLTSGLVELTLNPLALLFQATGIKPKQPPKFEL